jgi:4-hydroxy 2-oxovalerate aldolase
MSRIRVLDCTLRDGGYINNWGFGEKNIKFILNALDNSRLDIIEVGFLSNRIDKDDNLSKFTSMQDVSELIEKTSKDNLKVCMINFGEFSIDDIPQAKDVSVDGIRVAFHKKDLDEAIVYCQQLINKGYRVFLQPMVAANYTDEEYLYLIKQANRINPYAFYVVDSFGIMKQSDVIRYFFMADYNLKKDIYIGFHSHNNLQLSYSNAQALIATNTTRELIIDSSIHGMGRGAGNLNTELFLEYLNSLKLGDYDINPLLDAIDYVIKPIYLKKPWGYSLPHYLSAINNCHPNYATYLDDLATLTVKDMSIILSKLDPIKKNNFDREYIKKMYRNYQEENIELRDDSDKLDKILSLKDILLIAPGKSISLESNTIKSFIKNHKPIVLGVNFKPEEFDTDFLFFSNKRRYDKASPSHNKNIIVTSNIYDVSYDHYVVKYDNLLNQTRSVEDNAGLMLIKLLINIKVNKIYLAGFDGYDLKKSAEESFSKKEFSTGQTNERLERINLGMNYLINEFARHVDIDFVTMPAEIKLETT